MIAAPALAADLFTVQVQDITQGIAESKGFNSASDAIDQFKNGQLNSLIFNYQNTDVAKGHINYRGLEVFASYLTSGTTLNFSVPAAGINVTFSGTSRDNSQQMLADYLKKNNAYGQIMHALAASSPIDPVAGNPSSLMNNMVAQGFDSGAFGTSPSSGASAAGSKAGASRVSAGNLVGLGLDVGKFTSGAYSSSAYTVPLSYTFGVGHTGDTRISIDMPLTYVDTQGAQSGAAQLGVGVTMPMNDHWALTPRVSAGATGSIQLASAAALYAVSVTSAYRFDHNGYGFVIGDMVGYTHSIALTLGSYSVDPNIGSAYTKNGGMVAIPLSKLGAELSVLPGADLQVFVTDTYFSGTKLYENNLIEVGFNIGSSRLQVIGHDLRVGLTYLHGSGSSASSNGVVGNFGFTF